MNSVVLIGRLTRDPEMRNAGETRVATFTLAIDRPTAVGKEKKTDFPRVTVFGRQAENVERFLSKGMLVGIQGSIQTGSYTNRDGQTVYTTDVVASRVEFLEWKEKNASNAAYQAQPDYSQAANSAQARAAAELPAGIPEGFQAMDDDDIPF